MRAQKSNDPNDQNKPVRPTPVQELRRVGVREALINAFTCTAGAVAIILTAAVPWQNTSALDLLIALHATLLGFTFTVFGFTILGGKDDFFDPVIAAIGEKGVDALRTLVLELFFPVALQGLCLICCLLRRFCPPWLNHTAPSVAWRLLYAFLFVWGIFEIYHATEAIFLLAIRRLIWKGRKASDLRSKSLQTIPPAIPKPASCFLLVSGKSEGPFAQSELLEAVSDGRLTNVTFVWMQGMLSWMPASDVPITRAAILEKGPERLKEKSKDRFKGT